MDFKVWMEGALKKYREAKQRRAEQKAIVESRIDPRQLLTKKAIYGMTLGWMGVIGYFYMVNRNWAEKAKVSAAAEAAANEKAAAAAKRNSI